MGYDTETSQNRGDKFVYHTQERREEDDLPDGMVRKRQSHGACGDFHGHSGRDASLREMILLARMNSFGVLPVCFLKNVPKCDGVENDSSYATW